ncbi:MAG: AAA family ATPase [bacterium]
MGYRIAVGGKGGVGKTTLAALIVRSLLRHGRTPILAVDADPNTNLPEAIGLPTETTVGTILAQFIEDKASIPSGMTKESFLQVKMNAAISEGKGIDLIAMGRGEGPGCYCYPNLMLRGFVEKLSGNYAYVVFDNEAGMEHLSRRTSERIDDMLLVSDPSLRGIRSVRRIHELIRELNLDVARVSLVLARASAPLAPVLEQEIAGCGLPWIGTIPADPQIEALDLSGKPLIELPDSSPAALSCEKIMAALLDGSSDSGSGRGDLKIRS